ncbi:glycosyltransferase [bacterium]|nr:glycosyltransferase [bacterium]
MDIENSGLVSVLIPSYNHENYVQKTIKSIIEQTYKNIELIVIDDGSKDNTFEKILEMKDACEKRFVNVIFEKKQNEGTCKTFNKLLSLAKGEYVYIIASDDLAKPQAIEKETAFLSKHKDYALCVGDNDIIDENDVICYWDNERNNVYEIENAVFKTNIDFLNNERPSVDFNSSDFGDYGLLNYSNFIPNGYLIRRSIFEIIGDFTSEAPLEDYWLMLQISKFAKMKYIDEPLFSYRWHSNNTIKVSDRMKLYDEKTRAYEKLMTEKYKDDKRTTKGFKRFLKYGILYKKFGIPYVLQIQKFFKDDKRLMVVKLFNLDIFKHFKKR